MMKERRMAHRASANNRVSIYTVSGEVHKANLTNISATGLAIIFSAPADVGAKLLLKFSLFIGNKRKEFKIGCVVEHSHLKGNQYYIGVSFFSNTQAQEDDIIAYVEERNNLQSLAG